jgi:Holliday junction resolvase
MRLKSHLQYERDFCTMMQEKGFHTERVAASGRRRDSVCDVITFRAGLVYLTEIKSTKFEKYIFRPKQELLDVGSSQSVPILLAVYFKSEHSSKGKGVWVLKRVFGRTEVCKNDKSDRL